MHSAIIPKGLRISAQGSLSLGEATLGCPTPSFSTPAGLRTHISVPGIEVRGKRLAQVCSRKSLASAPEGRARRAVVARFRGCGNGNIELNHSLSIEFTLPLRGGPGRGERVLRICLCRVGLAPRFLAQNYRRHTLPNSSCGIRLFSLRARRAIPKSGCRPPEPTR